MLPNRCPVLTYEQQGGQPAEIFRPNIGIEGIRCPVGAVVMRPIVTEEGLRIVLKAGDNFGLAGIDRAPVAGTELAPRLGLLVSDTPERRHTAPFFTPTKVKEAQPAVADLAQSVVGPLNDGEDREVDLTLFADSFTGAVICDTLGVNREHWPAMRDLSESALRTLYTPDDIFESKKAWEGIRELYGNLADEADTDGIIAKVTNKLKEVGYTDDQTLNIGISIYNGFPTVLPVFIVALAELLRRPDVVRQCLENPELWPDAIDEALRYRAHFTTALPRVALKRTYVEGRWIEEGEVVLPITTAATRDPEAVEDPNEFRLGRNKGNKNRVFGHGQHYCLGAAMTRLWLETGLDTFFRTFPDAKLTVDYDDLAWQDGNLPTPKRVPVSLAA